MFRRTHSAPAPMYRAVLQMKQGTGLDQRQKIQANLAHNTGGLRPNKGRVKDEFTPALLSREDDYARAPIEDDGRDGNGELNPLTQGTLVKVL
jgi:hypothetical protein